MPGEGTGRVSPSPFEGGKLRGRRAGITPPPSGPREGASPSQFERDRGRGKPGERSPEPGAASGQHGAAKATPQSSFQGAPPQPERGRSPARQRGEEQAPGQGEQNPPQDHDQRIRFGTPAPMATGEHGPRGGGQPSGFRQAVTPSPASGPAGERSEEHTSELQSPM